MANCVPPGTISEVLLQNPSKRGLAIIITNDYGGAAALAGTRKDGARMQRVFDGLQIATLWKENVSGDDLRRLLREIPTLPRTYESISFVYSGHGSEGDVLCMQDGSKMHMQEIVNAFLPRRAPNVGNIPKLFFIDACRGSETFQPVVVPRTGGNVQVDRPQRSGTRDRGATDMRTVFVPPEGNTIIAYSNISRNRALEGKEGGVWMKALAKRMAESKESIENVLTGVRSDLQHMYQDPNWRGHMQLPETISHLLRPVYLHPDGAALRGNPVQQQPANVSPPGTLTQRDERHRGHYKGRLLHLQQKNIITDVTERYEKSFVCVLTFVKCSDRRRYEFRSEEFSGKQEAKESAARRAVLSLDLEARGVTNSPPRQQAPPRNAHSVSPPQPSCQQGKANATGPPPAAPAPVSPANKDPKSRLKEYCEKNRLPQPVYEVVECGDARHQVRVKVSGKSFYGELKTAKKEAEKSAAQKALAKLL
ncbi:Caspase-2 [Geodia barretti]|uniref:Caspase-2 n=1 Tax=Geodia barretti TaxID=519541 RepID=A0AA35SWT1_GEOBA|nr:Caspase-2 [Geodia barretti]